MITGANIGGGYHLQPVLRSLQRLPVLDNDISFPHENTGNTKPKTDRIGQEYLKEVNHRMLVTEEYKS